MKTQGLKQALETNTVLMLLLVVHVVMKKNLVQRTCLFISVMKHRWDPKSQRPELWNVYNGKVNKGESIRVFHYQTGLSLIFGNIST